MQQHNLQNTFQSQESADSSSPNEAKQQTGWQKWLYLHTKIKMYQDNHHIVQCTIIIASYTVLVFFEIAIEPKKTGLI